MRHPSLVPANPTPNQITLSQRSVHGGTLKSKIVILNGLLYFVQRCPEDYSPQLVPSRLSLDPQGRPWRRGVWGAWLIFPTFVRRFTKISNLCFCNSLDMADSGLFSEHPAQS